jgi:type IV pilus assembly protein PilM
MSLFSIPQRFNFSQPFSFFKAADTMSLGVDIGSASIKVVQLRKEKERAMLQTYGELALAGYAKGDDGHAIVMVDDRLKEALADVLRESQVKATKAVVSLPLKNSFITTMTMPELTPSEMKDAITYEARKYIPIPIAETTIDWWVLPPQAMDAAQQGGASGAFGDATRRHTTNVLLVAVPNDIINKYKSIFDGVGIKIEAFEIESFALARSAIRQEGGAVMIADLGASTTKLAMVEAGVVHAAHSIDQGAWRLTQALQQSLGVDFDRAELMKREFGIVHRPETQGAVSVMEPIVEALLAEGERFLLDWKRKGGRSISKVLIAGGGALLHGMDDAMVRKYGVEVEMINPFSKVLYPAFLEPSLKEIGSVFGNAVGLALRGF